MPYRDKAARKENWAGIRSDPAHYAAYLKSRLGKKEHRTLTEKVCKQCGHHFKTRKAKFCSLACWYKWRTEEWEKKPPRLCTICGGPVRKGANTKTCSYTCFRKLRPTTKTCTQCGGQFNARGHLRKFCSHRCSTEFNRKIPPINCLNCGKEFRPPTLSRSRKYCSRACCLAYSVGPNNPHWRGNRRLERGVTWAKNRDLAREKDLQMCQGCGVLSVPGQKISVDHIVPYSLAKAYAAENPLYDPNHQFNLVCLCRSCHTRKTHIETRLLRGDIIGFLAEAKAVIPVGRLVGALKYSGLPVPPALEVFA